MTTQNELDKAAPPSKFVRVDDAEQRLDRIWLEVAPRLSGAHLRAARFPAAWAGFGLAAALAVLALWVFPGSFGASSPSVFEGAALETAGDSLKLDLEDGSALALAAETRVELARSSDVRVELALTRGSVECRVAKNPAREFVVVAKGVQVRVTGTRFSVEVSPDERRVEVRVLDGSVEVVPPGPGALPRRLAAGERWSIELSPESSSNPEPSTDGAGSTAEGAMGERSALENIAGDTTALRDAAPEPKGAPPSSVAAPGTAPEGARSSARELLDRANGARREGNVAVAAQAYERLLREHPEDPRAGLAAFELGRLKMDRLGDLRGAVTALRRAVATAPGAGFREDAMARLAQAYAAMGATESCRKAKGAYASAYPAGVHAASVRRLCPEQ